MNHICKFGDPRCGKPTMFESAYSTLCPYCKKAAAIELAAKENELQGNMARQQRESRDAAYEAIGSVIADHPVATIGGLLALGLGVAIANDKKKSDEFRKDFIKKKTKK